MGYAHRLPMSCLTEEQQFLEHGPTPAGLRGCFKHSIDMDEESARGRNIKTRFMLHLHVTALPSSHVCCGVPSMLLVAL